jgi:alkylation response protein AidB-like acyl-CoA dehydrogenase
MAAVSIDSFVNEARQWLDRHAALRKSSSAIVEPGDPFSTAVFHALTFEQEERLLSDLRGWNQLKATEGYHAIAWPVEFGGLGLSEDHARAFSRLELNYQTPGQHELFTVTVGLIAPTVRQFGDADQQRDFVEALLRTDIFCCQLFSEPGAGSDLASLACRGVRDGDQWVVNGQKVWSSGAQFAEWGMLIARTDPDVPKHQGLSVFLVPMDSPGIEARPIRQMSGGSSFNEVFLTDVHVPDRLRLGPVGAGWKVALTTLGFERDHSAADRAGPRAGGTWEQIVATARTLARTRDPVVRQALTKLYSHARIEAFVNHRAADLRAAGAIPGPEGSLGKLLWTEGMRQMSDVASLLVGPALVADSGQWGTFEWGEHVLGAPGYRIAGGSDEIQRNILAERVLGLPAEPRIDKDAPWRQLPR